MRLEASPEYTSALENVGNYAYLGSLYFGSEAQELNLIFDTGSAVSYMRISL